MNYTSISQSKKLLELGLSPESADMIYNPQMDIDGNCANGFVNHPEIYPYKDIIHSDKNLYLPCWSLGALLELMPKTLDEHYALLLSTWNRKSKIWGVDYVNLRSVQWIVGDKAPSFSGKGVDPCWSEDILIATYKRVVWLLENNYIKKEGNT